MFPTDAFPHGGGLDSNGGHHDRKNGGYHFHRGGGSSSIGSYRTGSNLFSTSGSVASSYRPRTTARTSPRLSYHAKARQAKESLKSSRVVGLTGEQTEPEYLFHHVDHVPYKAVSFEDIKDTWRLLMPNGSHIRLSKSRIVRIEPINDKKKYRTWIDSTGTHSVVAKYIDTPVPKVELEKLSSVHVQVDLSKLSGYDQEFALKLNQEED